jgi:hypothetical protein
MLWVYGRRKGLVCLIHVASKDTLVGASGEDTDFCKTPFSTYRRLNQWLLEKASSDICPFF